MSHTNLGQRQIKSPKIYVPDTGVPAYLTGISEERLLGDAAGNLTGMFFETFVAMELVRQSEWAEEEVSLTTTATRRSARPTARLALPGRRRPVCR